MEGYELSVSFDERNDQSISYSYDNYDSYNKNSWDVSDANGLIPYGEHDEQGRLLKNVSEIVDYDTLPEDLDVFISKWQPQQLCSSKDWEWTSRYTWPDVDGVVTLKRLDLFQTETPQSQQATGDIEESRRIRNTPGWYPVRSLFLLNIPTQWTKLIHIESTGPPRRHRVNTNVTCKSY